MPILPIAAQHAGDEPVSAANRAQAPRLEITRPPGTRYSQRSSASYRSLPAGEEPIAAPIITNMGIDTSVKSSKPLYIVAAATPSSSHPRKNRLDAYATRPRPTA